MSKDYVLLQKENIRILIYDETPDDNFRKMMVNIVVGASDITLTQSEYHRLYKLMNLANQANKRTI